MRKPPAVRRHFIEPIENEENPFENTENSFRTLHNFMWATLLFSREINFLPTKVRQKLPI